MILPIILKGVQPLYHTYGSNVKGVIKCSKSCKHLSSFIQHSSMKCLIIRATEMIHSRAVIDFLFLFYCLSYINSIDSSIDTVYYTAAT